MIGHDYGVPEDHAAGLGRSDAVVAARPRRRLLVVLLALFVLAAIAGTAAAIAGAGTGYVYGTLRGGEAAEDSPAVQLPGDAAGQKKALGKLRTQQKQLAGALQAKAPRGYWVVVDQTQNRIYLKKDAETLLDARCSAGSGMVLKEPEGGKGRRWVFDTPRGVFKVRSRQENPVWKKPDWAFVEEGKPIPKRDEDRMDYGTLGEYSFQLGDGYMIHGTLYERLLGRSVTHGCIRVGRDDLRVLWKHVLPGTPVYIY